MEMFVLTSSSSLLLRKLTVFTFPPALVLCIVHGIVSGVAVPALGLVPMFASFLLGAFLMYRDKIAFAGSPVSLSRAQICLSDLLLAALLLLVLILSWIFVPKDHYRTRMTMLGTYATVPLLVNCGLHFYFFIGNGMCFLDFHQGCPNCRLSTHAQETQPALRSDGQYRDDVGDVEAQAQ